MTVRQDARKELAGMATEIRALRFAPEGQTLVRFLKLQQDLICIDLETVDKEDLHKLQGRLCAIREIINAISG